MKREPVYVVKKMALYKAEWQLYKRADDTPL